MPFVEADVKARITKLDKIMALKSCASRERQELFDLLDVVKTEAIPAVQQVSHQDTKPDGTLKFEADGIIPVMVIDVPAKAAVPAVFDKPMDHGTQLTTAERDRRAVHHLEEADKIIADAAAV